MMKLILLLIIPSLYYLQEVNDHLVGNWKLQSYDAIEKIKKSPAYLAADEDTRQLINQQFSNALKAVYNFKKDTLIYHDIQGDSLIQRKALWSREDLVIYIKEIDRPFQREAYIRKLTSDTLIISPIIDGSKGESRMTFTK